MNDETKSLIEAAKNGDEGAAEVLVKKNMGLIKSAAMRFYGRGVDAEDLFQLGALGFIKAVKRFDLSYSVELSTYAVPMILGEIRRFLRDDGIIKVSRSARECAAKIRRIKDEEGDMEIEKIAERIGVSYEDAIYALEATRLPDSIDKTISDDDSTRGEKIAAKGDDEEERCIKLSLKESIKKLGERDRQLVTLRFYKELTQSQTARILGISQVQVSRLEKKIIGEMRKELESI